MSKTGFSSWLIILGLLFTGYVQAQTCTITASGGWGTRVCNETGLAPGAGNTIIINSGVTVTTNSNNQVLHTGNVIVFGTLDINHNNVELNGNVTIENGGILDITGGNVSLGTSANCGYTVIVKTGGLIDVGTTGSDRLIICGVVISRGGGGCGSYPTGPLHYCEPTGGFTGPIALDETGDAGRTFTWLGTTSNWTTASNWSPTRTTLTTEDILIFNATGSIKNVTNVPTQTVGRIQVTGNSTYTFTDTSPRVLTLSNTNTTVGSALQIDNGSSLSLGTGGNALSLNLPANGFGEIGGQLNLINGNFNVSSATLTLHTNSAPLARTGGQVTVNATTVFNFGNASFTGGSSIVLPDNIFVASPITIASLTVNRTNGVTFGNQAITVDNSTTLTLGNLITNASGSIRYSTTATSPVESSASHIVGYAEMNLRAVGTGAIDFLGLNVASGVENIGSMSIVRRTGPSGINTFNTNQSIASTWNVTISGSEPTSGRNLVFRWLPEFDNVTNSLNRYQSYIFDSGPGWTALGPLANLTATTPLRQTAAAPTVKLNDAFTVTDESQTLPIVLLYFRASSVAEGILTEWATSKEEGFDHFEIDRASSNLNFSTLAEVPGAGYNTTTYQEYSWMDENPLVGHNYYRLKAVDLDGSYEYFNVVFVATTGKRGFSVFPNPFNGRNLKYRINFDFTPGDRIILMNSMGREIQSSPVSSIEDYLNLSESLKPGVYFVKYSSAGFEQNVKFVVH